MSETQHNATTKKRARWVAAFLAVLRETSNVRRACEAAGIERSTAYRLRDKDTEFNRQWDEAMDEGSDLLEEEARRRAHVGWDEPVFGRIAKDTDGEVGIVRKYSDTLLIFLLKGARPEKYRERQDVQHSGRIEIEYVNDWRQQETK